MMTLITPEVLPCPSMFSSWKSYRLFLLAATAGQAMCSLQPTHERKTRQNLIYAFLVWYQKKGRSGGRGEPPIQPLQLKLKRGVTIVSWFIIRKKREYSNRETWLLKILAHLVKKLFIVQLKSRYQLKSHLYSTYVLHLPHNYSYKGSPRFAEWPQLTLGVKSQWWLSSVSPSPCSGWSSCSSLSGNVHSYAKNEQNTVSKSALITKPSA